MKRLLFILLFLTLMIFPKYINAESDFNIRLHSKYYLDENGTSKISDTFEIQNIYTEKYLPSFEYKIDKIDPENIEVLEDGRKTEFQEIKSEGSSVIKINFSNKILGKGNKNIFSITYTSKNLAIHTGDVWEISFPKIENLDIYNDINTDIYIPQTFGDEAYITPNYKEKELVDNYVRYSFNKNSLSNSRIVAAFGKYQIFNFSINYHLDNSSPVKIIKNVTLPMDTSYQRIYFESINPQPIDIKIDEDGNWIGYFQIPANNNLDIKVNGTAQIFANPRSHLIPKVENLYNNIKSTEYWQSDNQEIKAISQKLKDPREIYDYVINILSYDYNLSKSDRKNTVSILKSSYNSTCRDYSDLMISLLRAKGIPAREVIGYAYTDNPNIKPIAFFNDVLHSWVEYWDAKRKLWISVDPTWGETSKSDYFGNFDLRHLALTIHGNDDSLPQPPGFYSKNGYSKDIYIEFGNFNSYNEKDLIINNNISNLFFINRNLNIQITNPNSFAVYEKNIKYYLSNKLVSEDNYKIITPFSNILKNIYIKYTFMGRGTPSDILVSINGHNHDILGPKNIDTYSQLILTFISIIIIIFIFLYLKYQKNKKWKKI